MLKAEINGGMECLGRLKARRKVLTYYDVKLVGYLRHVCLLLLNREFDLVVPIGPALPIGQPFTGVDVSGFISEIIFCNLFASTYFVKG